MRNLVNCVQPRSASFHLYFFLLLLFDVRWRSRSSNMLVEALCPQRCTCNDLAVLCDSTQTDNVPIYLNPSLQKLSLSKNRIKNVYSSFTLYQDLVMLNLSHNLISELDRKSFVIQKLQILLLNNNQLRELNARVFMGLNRLETLDLSYNQIESISTDAFFACLNLKTLNLQANRLRQVPSFFYLQNLASLSLAANLLSHLPELAFSPLTTLQKLVLDANHIGHISVSAFVHLSNLTALHLEGNRLLSVPTESLGVLGRLETLHIGRNPISTLRPHTFRGLNQLKTLVVSNSPLNTIDRAALLENGQLSRLLLEHNRHLAVIEEGIFAAQTTSLRYLSLRGNGISTLRPGTLSTLARLRHLDLRENPLACNCSLDWLASWLRANNGSLSAEHVKCIAGNNIHGPIFNLASLSRSDLSCPAHEEDQTISINIIEDLFSSQTLTSSLGGQILLGLLTTLLALVLLVVLLLLFCRKNRFWKCFEARRRAGASTTLPSSADEPMIGGHNQHNNNNNSSNYTYSNSTLSTGTAGKSRPLAGERALFPPYPTTTINEDFTRKGQHFQQQQLFQQQQQGQNYYYYHSMTGTPTNNAKSATTRSPFSDLQYRQYGPISHI